MLIFIDESGDAGFQFDKGSSRTFTVALIIFEDEKDAEETVKVIKEYRKSLRKEESFEFKFNKANRLFRINFLNAIKSCNFRIRYSVFYKTSIHASKHKEAFYNYALKSALSNIPILLNAKIRIDGLNDKSFRKKLIVYLRRELNKNIKETVKKIQFVDSKHDDIIQMADMIASSINKFYSERKSDYQDYYSVIKPKIDN